MARQIKLSRRRSNRNALVSNLVSSLVISGRIITTEQRAKAAKVVAEKILSRAKQPSLANQRYIRSILNKVAAEHLTKTLASKLPDTPGGTIKLIKVVARKGDAADQAALVVITKPEPAPLKSKKKTAVKQ